MKNFWQNLFSDQIKKMMINNIRIIFIITALLTSSAWTFLGKTVKSEKSESESEKVNTENLRGIAILQGLNKVTAKTSELKIRIGGQTEFGKLAIKVKRCWRSSLAERPENKILIEVDEVENDGTRKQIFNGWMFSSSPSISGIEHPVYDLVAIECIN